MSDGLGGIGVLVTRPQPQAARLAQAVRAAGGEPLLFPAIEIEAHAADRIRAGLAAVADAKLLVFASPNAARIALGELQRCGGLPPGAAVAAVGAGTARVLESLGVRGVIAPRQGSGTEALLAGTALQDIDRGDKVAIVRGEGGRELLADSLRKRGAEVRLVECYRRRPAQDAAGLRRLLASARFSAWTATSAEIVDNLVRLAGKPDGAGLLGAPLFVTHPRIAARAFSLGARIIVVCGAGDAGLLEGIRTWFGRLRSDSRHESS